MPGKTGQANKRLTHGVVWLIATVVFLSDSLIKNYLRQTAAFQSFPIIENILHITIVFNPGAAFGILKGKTTMLVYTSIFFIIFFFTFINKEKNRNLLFLISCGLILGGAASNLCDRLFLGYVVDYIDLRIWPVFNLSDSCISIGAALLFLDSFRKSKVNPCKRDS
ncbi:MAG: signal peptidase II [Candidatus Omnitrophica bacterium]|nr:signal peptidase II [Candidatus Omnitrophota bacterium]